MRGAGIVLAGCLLSCTLPALDAGASSAREIDGADCARATAWLRGHDIDLTGVEAGRVAIDGWAVDFRASRWRAQHPTNPSLTMLFHSAAWLVPQSLEQVPQAIDRFVEQSIDQPDPGSPNPVEMFVPVGWTEAAVTIRMSVANCLYAKASPEDQVRLLPVMQALIQANTDPNRYYGPPINRPHNHGVMADRALLDTARLLGRPDLIVEAEGRLRSQLSGMYDSCGITLEQSSGYQFMHAGLWDEILVRVEDPDLRAQIAETSVKARAAALDMAYPDGTIPVIGDGDGRTGIPLADVRAPVDRLCPETGWFISRHVGGALSQQVVARFGPKTTFHGHADKGSLTWWVGAGQAGHQVLADRGLPGKNRDDSYAYAVGSDAHATLVWPMGSNAAMTAEESTTQAGTELTMATDPARERGSWRRTVDLNDTLPVLTVSDEVAGPLARRPATQNFPLDPAWTPAGRPGLYSTSDGYLLTIRCTTSSGARIPVSTHRAMDFQQDAPRDARTASCTAKRAGQGLVASLVVTLPGQP